MSGLASIALAASMSSSVSFGGRPPVRSARRAAARPAWVRSRIRLRSNSASAHNIRSCMFSSDAVGIELAAEPLARYGTRISPAHTEDRCHLAIDQSTDSRICSVIPYGTDFSQYFESFAAVYRVDRR